jgi:hypothetical protein
MAIEVNRRYLATNAMASAVNCRYLATNAMASAVNRRYLATNVIASEVNRRYLATNAIAIEVNRRYLAAASLRHSLMSRGEGRFSELAHFITRLPRRLAKARHNVFLSTVTNFSGAPSKTFLSSSEQK